MKNGEAAPPPRKATAKIMTLLAHPGARPAGQTAWTPTLSRAS